MFLGHLAGGWVLLLKGDPSGWHDTAEAGLAFPSPIQPNSCGSWEPRRPPCLSMTGSLPLCLTPLLLVS